MEEIVKEFKDLKLAVKQRDEKIQELQDLIKILKRTIDYSNDATETEQLVRSDATLRINKFNKSFRVNTANK